MKPCKNARYVSDFHNLTNPIGHLIGSTESIENAIWITFLAEPMCHIHAWSMMEAASYCIWAGHSCCARIVSSGGIPSGGISCADLSFFNPSHMTKLFVSDIQIFNSGLILKS